MSSQHVLIACHHLLVQATGFGSPEWLSKSRWKITFLYLPPTVCCDQLVAFGGPVAEQEHDQSASQAGKSGQPASQASGQAAGQSASQQGSQATS